MLYQTVEEGTGNKARIEGYKIGGKTGTAEKQPRDDERYLVSFISFAPVDDPQIVLYVVIDEPNIPKQSDASQATIMTNKLYKEILPYMGIFSDIDPEPEPEPETGSAEPETGSEPETSSTKREPQDEAWEPGWGFMGPITGTSTAETTSQ